MAARQPGALLLSGTDANSRRLGKDQLGQPLSIFGIAEHRKQHARTAFFHLNCRGKYVQGPFLQGPVHYVAEDLGRHVIDIGLQNDNSLFGRQDFLFIAAFP